MSSKFPITKLNISVKHKIWSESVMTKKYKVPQKILKILNSFVRKTNRLIHVWRRLEIFKYNEECLWEKFVYMVCIYHTWFNNKYIYWDWSYITTLYFSKDWICLNNENNFLDQEYLKPFIEQKLMKYQQK